ncbi:hypothetical protein [Kribbella deserti]|uniref:DUF975 family protein n=1 Tax=Kribbella deserti TaxID=1926257 RepID=A0ABV6QU79_9ACTN
MARYVRLSWLPPDQASYHEALRQERRRLSTRLYSALGGLALAGLVLTLPLLLSEQRGIFESSMRLQAALAVSWLGLLLSIWLGQLREVRRRRSLVTARAAQLRPRRFADYLTPMEIITSVVPAGLAVWPALLAIVLLDAGDQGLAWLLFAVSLLQMVFLLMVGLLARAALLLPSLATSESQLRWEEAERARNLRDIAQLAAQFGMGFGGFWPFMIQLQASSPLPLAVSMLTTLLFGLSTVPLAYLTYASHNAAAVGRSQRSFVAPGAFR